MIYRRLIINKGISISNKKYNLPKSQRYHFTLNFILVMGFNFLFTGYEKKV